MQKEVSEVEAMAIDFRMKALQCEINLAERQGDVSKELKLKKKMVSELEAAITIKDEQISMVQLELTKLQQINHDLNEDLDKLSSHVVALEAEHRVLQSSIQNLNEEIEKIQGQLEEEKKERALDKVKYEEAFQRTHENIIKSGPTLRKEAARAFMFSETYQRLLVKKEAGDMMTVMKRAIGQLKIKGLIPKDLDAAAEIDLTLNEDDKESEDEELEGPPEEEETEVGVAQACEFQDLFDLDPEKDESTDTFAAALDNLYQASSVELDAAGLKRPTHQIDWQKAGGHAESSRAKDAGLDTESPIQET